MIGTQTQFDIPQSRPPAPQPLRQTSERWDKVQATKKIGGRNLTAHSFFELYEQQQLNQNVPARPHSLQQDYVIVSVDDLIQELKLAPSKFYADELLDWDAAIEVAPTRPSGTLTVTLQYAGRGKPTPIEDPWA
jgi:hypothetical protein